MEAQAKAVEKVVVDEVHGKEEPDDESMGDDEDVDDESEDEDEDGGQVTGSPLWDEFASKGPLYQEFTKRALARKAQLGDDVSEDDWAEAFIEVFQDALKDHMQDQDEAAALLGLDAA